MQMSKKAVRFDSAGNLTRIGYFPSGSGPSGVNWQTTARGMCPIGHGIYNTANQPTADDPCNVAWLTYIKKLSDLYGGYTKADQVHLRRPADLERKLQGLHGSGQDPDRP